MWSREEDMQHGFYHSGSKSRFQIKLGNNGLPVQIENQFVKPSHWMQNFKIFSTMGFDPFSHYQTAHSHFINKRKWYDFGVEHYYKINKVNVKYEHLDLGIPVGF